jgi:WD40 repeat protein/tetratricopeptide (TPR) repeat protein/tRNA A-37 threonylcarbamoyl transferase component Bud32
MNTDRNLLFGILALQLDFITRDALIAAMNAWVLDKGKSLGQILLDQGALRPDTHQVLETLVQKHLELHGHDPEQSLAAIHSVDDVRADLQHVEDTDIQASLAHVAAARADDPYAKRVDDDPYATRVEGSHAHGPADAVGTPTSSGRRFRILRPHARGGLGQVSVALDEELHREVALKEIQDRHADEPESRARFVLEAEITGSLEHPGVVPVYGLGRSADGRPYYAMRFIQGDSLQEAVEHFHQPDQAARDPAEQTLALRGLLRRFVDVCNAVAYAHSRGVLHRDLKPGNVMLGPYGETLVVDWGLAKPAGRPEDEDGHREAAFRPWALGTVLPTLVGQVVGTPGFMSPEQAAGRLEELGPASDVYSLGATLYAVLTGRAPVESPDPGAVLQQVPPGDGPPPRPVNPAVPVARAAICRKAMARQPEARYSTALALAAEVERWLADEPVGAYRDPVTVRLGRWGRRHQKLVAGGTALLVTAVLALAIGLGAVEQERQQTLAANTRERAARNEAQELSAGMRLDKGIDLAERGDISAGLLWMLEAAQTAPEQSVDLRRVARLNLAAWLGQTPALRRMVPLPQLARCLALHPDGKRLAVGCGSHKSGTVHWIDTTTLQSVGPALKHAGPVGALAIRADGRLLLSAVFLQGSNSRVRCWDVDSGQPRGASLASSCKGAVFRPDGAVFVVVDAGFVHLHDAATGKIVQELPLESRAGVACLAFSPDGNKLVVAPATTGKVRPAPARVWDLTSGGRRPPAGQPLGQPLLHTGPIKSVAFSPDGQQIVTASADGTAQRWDAASGQPVGPALHHGQGVASACFAPDGRTLTTRDEQGTLFCWDAATGQRLAGTLPRSSAGPPQHLADGKYLLTAEDFSPSVVWDHDCTHALIWQAPRGASAPLPLGEARAWQQRADANRPREEVFFSPDRTTALRINSHGWVRLVDVASGQPRGRPQRHPWPLTAAAFSPDSKRVAVTSHDLGAGEGGSTACLWQVLDTTTGQPVSPLLPHPNWVRSLAFSPDGRALLTGGFDGLVHFWDAATGRELGQPLRQPSIVLSFALSPDGQTLAVHHSWEGAGRHGLVLWDVPRRRRKGPTLPGEPGTRYLFSPDSKVLATIQPGEDVYRLWDTATGAPTGVVLRTEPARVSQVLFSPDSRTLLTGSQKGTVRLWEIATGRPLGKPMLHLAEVLQVAFSPDPEGKYILIGYGDDSYRLWDRDTCRPLGPPIYHRTEINACTFTPDGRSFATSAVDGSIRVWPVPSLPADDGQASASHDRLRLEVRTGLTLRNSETVEQLRPDEWQARQQRLVELEGSAESACGGFLDDRTWHDRQAREAEQEGDSCAAAWHLDRLLASSPPAGPAPDWRLYARRARAHAAAGRLDQADADYAEALKRGSPAQLADWYRQGAADCELSVQWGGALWYLDRALAADPTDWKLYEQRAGVQGKLGRAAERDADLERATQRGADAAFLLRRAEEHARQGRWEKAADAFAAASARGPIPAATWQAYLLVRLRLGDLDNYRRLCAKLVQAVPPEAHLANAVAWMCALGPDAVPDFQPLLRRVETAAAQVPAAAKHDVLNTVGALLYRAGRYQDAIDRLQEGIAANKGQGVFEDFAFLAMAMQRLGRTEEAKRWLEQVRAQKRTEEDKQFWHNLRVDLLRQEVETVVQGKPKDGEGR